MDSTLEEIEAIKAIYCGEGEYVTHKFNDAEQIFTVKIQCGKKAEDRVSISFTLNNRYPDCVPELSLQSTHLTRKQCEALKNDLLSFSKSLLGQPMLMDLLTWIQDNSDRYSDKVKSTNCSNEKDSLVTCLLHLDHMRARGKYVKTIQKWTEELSLTGKLIFYDKLILILLQGPQADVKEYIQRQRTVNVDVDSKGRSCKERMLSLLSEQELKEEHRLSHFTVVESASVEELKSVFTSSSLDGLYLTNVLPLFKR